jgi:hypothetical protein
LFIKKTTCTFSAGNLLIQVGRHKVFIFLPVLLSPAVIPIFIFY